MGDSLFQTLTVNPACTIAPPPSIRRQRPLPAEPALFALLLTLLTLAINMTVPQARADHEATKSLPQQVAAVR
jgi:hypothetical protein